MDNSLRVFILFLIVCHSYCCLPGTYYQSRYLINGQYIPVCAPCLAGKYQTSDTYWGPPCLDCQAGKFQSQTGKSICNNCHLGTYQSQTGTTTCKGCEIGTFQNTSGLSFCYPCSAGSYQSSTSKSICSLCSPGSYQTLRNATSCLLCEAVRYRTSYLGTTNLGTYQSGYGATACKSCLSPEYSNQTGSTVCTRCTPGKYVFYWEDPFCRPCDYFSYSSQFSQTSCDYCPSGSHASTLGQSACDTCALGTYTDTVLDRFCVPCPQGTFQTNLDYYWCESCAQGTYQNNTGKSVCTACSSGKFNSLSRMTDESYCNLCSPGKFQNVTGASFCQDCEAGKYYTGLGGVSCITCNLTLYLPGQTECLLCSPGSYQANKMDTACTSCVKGTSYNPFTGMTTCLLCKQCNDMEYFSRVCTETQNSVCSSCGSCQLGWYEAGRCVQGSSGNVDTAQPTYCKECDKCPSGYFLSDGCVNGLPAVCSNCTVCDGGPLVECTSFSDAVCGGVSDCRHNASNQVLSWLQPSHYCSQGQYFAGWDSSKEAPLCSPCPDGTYGPNGLWCEVCPGYKTAYFDGTQCVCYENTIENAYDNCECPSGHEFLDQGCIPCSAGKYSDTSLELRDEWWTQYKQCELCPNGTDSLPGATACDVCPFGMFREASSSDVCQNCSQTGAYATDPTSGSSCTPCNSSCETGFFPTPCPTYVGSDLFLCQPCASRPPNATSTAALAATANTACNWQCDSGFYQANGSACVPCSSGPCPPGYNRSACTPLADSDCDTACVDPNKPLRNSVWTSGCSWACAEGYELSAADYVLWVQYSCVAAGSRLFEIWD